MCLKLPKKNIKRIKRVKTLKTSGWLRDSDADGNENSQSTLATPQSRQRMGCPKEVYSASPKEEMQNMASISVKVFQRKRVS